MELGAVNAPRALPYPPAVRRDADGSYHTAATVSAEERAGGSASCWLEWSESIDRKKRPRAVSSPSGSPRTRRVERRGCTVEEEYERGSGGAPARRPAASTTCAAARHCDLETLPQAPALREARTPQRHRSPALEPGEQLPRGPPQPSYPEAAARRTRQRRVRRAVWQRAAILAWRSSGPESVTGEFALCVPPAVRDVTRCRSWAYDNRRCAERSRRVASGMRRFDSGQGGPALTLLTCRSLSHFDTRCHRALHAHVIDHNGRHRRGRVAA